MNLLQVDNLRIQYPGAALPAVCDLSFALNAGEAVGLVGESGSGKTQTALGIMGLLPVHARVQGSVRFDGSELVGKSDKLLNRFRARRIAMIFQDPMLALNPYVRIGDQLRRILCGHRIARRAAARTEALNLLAQVGLPDPERQYRSYAHQLSGGMRQRATIALALAAGPDVLIADEPTTALDVTVQAQILGLLHELREKSGIALMLITHDLGVIAENCDRMIVLLRGRVLEQGATVDVFRRPSHAHTRALIDAALRIDDPAVVDAPVKTNLQPLMRIDGLSVNFKAVNGAGGSRKPTLKAVRSANLALLPGETVAVVGESGSGKTTLARAIVGLLPADAGAILFLGKAVAGSVRSRPPAVRRALQMVFQDPVSSLDPAMKVRDIIAEPVRLLSPRLTRSEREQRVVDMLRRVGLDPLLRQRFPHELSGGQAQRVAIARSLVLEPKVLICDEAVAALDGTIRKEILELLREEQQRSGLSLIFITHDLGVVRRISHRVLVMYMGRVCELADNGPLFERPRHPYTRALMDAVPVPDPSRQRRPAQLAGEPVSLLDPPPGCVFHPRCKYAIERCRIEVPELLDIDGGEAACHRAAELDLR